MRRSCKLYSNWGGSSAKTFKLIIAGPQATSMTLAEAQQRSRSDRTSYSLQEALEWRRCLFTLVADPVGQGYVNSLGHPGGNVTGFTTFEFNVGGKWLELLKEIAPAVTRAAVIREPTIAGGIGFWSAIQALAPSVGVEVIPLNVSDPGEIERAVTSFASTPNGGLIVTGSALAVLHRDLIITLADRHKLPAFYFERHFIAAGGLISYRPDFADQYRQAASLSLGMLIAFSRATRRLTYRCKRQQGTGYSSISRLLRRST
jgi:ABC-type uncharacterized transport system substrate-binding protein